MGRKRNQGKARRAAKAKAEERGNNNGQTTAKEQEQSPAAQLQQVQSAIPECGHGFTFKAEGISVFSQFVHAFNRAFAAARGSNASLSQCLTAAQSVTMLEFADVWSDSAKMKSAMSFFLFSGTQYILKGYYNYARENATIIRFMEQHIAVRLKQTPLFNWPKIFETYQADMHSLVKFFRHRIPCSCLNDKYEEVKHIPKMGFCYNKQCTHPEGRVERSKTMYCSRCRCAVYCSRACQVSHWPEHKDLCDKNGIIQAEFDARLQNTLPR